MDIQKDCVDGMNWPDENYYNLLGKYDLLKAYMAEIMLDIGENALEWKASLDMFLEYCFTNIALEKGYISEKEMYVMKNLPSDLELAKEMVPGFTSFIRRLNKERFLERKNEMFKEDTMRIFVDKLTKVNLMRPTCEENNPYLTKVKEQIIDMLTIYKNFDSASSNWMDSELDRFLGENIEKVKVERQQEYQKKIDMLKAERQPEAVEEAVLKDKEILLKNCLDKLNGLVGLSEVKEEINGLVTAWKLAKIREEQGIAVRKRQSYHLVFTGNPGTGKTTVARIVSGIYYSLDVLKEDKIVETGRADLVAEYVGQTAPKTLKVINNAKGGVLFIDEAYSLTENSSGNDFGKEAVDTLVQYMENYRDELVVIVAGYDDKMQNFLEANEGLRSRFSRVIHFQNYSVEELEEILDLYLSEGQFIMEDAARNEFIRFFEMDVDINSTSFANARTVRKFVDAICVELDKRIAKEISGIGPENMKAFLQTITIRDVINAEETMEKGSSKKEIGFYR